MDGSPPLLIWNVAFDTAVPLYVLSAETMAINIRENPKIHGIQPPDSEAELKVVSIRR